MNHQPADPLAPPPNDRTRDRLEPPPAHDPDDVCWCCEGRTVKRHCKIVCTNCGFMRDCSDP